MQASKETFLYYSIRCLLLSCRFTLLFITGKCWCCVPIVENSTHTVEERKLDSLYSAGEGQAVDKANTDSL